MARAKISSFFRTELDAIKGLCEQNFLTKRTIFQQKVKKVKQLAIIRKKEGG
jgi:hypothetical protein